eukprot:968015-Rhodomonas_salina.2
MPSTDRVYGGTLSAYARARRCPVLRQFMVLSDLLGRDLGTRGIRSLPDPRCESDDVMYIGDHIFTDVNLAKVLPSPYAMSGTDIAYGPTRALRDVRY